MVKYKSFYIEVDPLFLLILPVMIFLGCITEFLTVLISMLLHELGHVFSAISFGRRAYFISILPVGFKAVIEELTYNKYDNLIIYSAGPLVNLALALAGWALNHYNLHNMQNVNYFILSNIYMAVFNLIPAIPLDGGKILREILADRIGFLLANRYIKNVNLVVAVLLVILGIVQLYGQILNFSLILIGLYLVFSIKSEETGAAVMNVKSVIYRRSRFLKKGIYAARDLVVIKSMHLSEVIKNMDFDRFHIIYVVDENLRFVDVFTEQEVIDGLLKYDSELTFEDLVKNKKMSDCVNL